MTREQERTAQTASSAGAEQGAASAPDKRTNRWGLLRSALGVAAAGVGAGALLETQAGTALANGQEGQTYFKSATSTATVTAVNAGSGNGIVSISTSGSGIGVVGTGSSSSSSNIGVQGTGATGVIGNGNTSQFGTGVEGNGYIGLSGTGSFTSGSMGPGLGVYGYGYYGVQGSGSYGVQGTSSASTSGGFGIGVQGTGPHGVQGTGLTTNGTGIGVYGVSAEANGVGVYGEGPSAQWAGYFYGNVDVNGTLSKSGGTFKIDHPLAPAEKYLYHSFVESPDMKNIYDGVVVLDAAGQAAVELPNWFEALNADLRYQLTPVGGPGAGLHIAAEARDNRFTIAGGTPGLTVCWQVTGVRQDAWANAHHVQVEVDKPAEERGYYLHPELYGAPAERGIPALRRPALSPPPAPPQPPAAPPSRRASAAKTVCKRMT